MSTLTDDRSNSNSSRKAAPSTSLAEEAKALEKALEAVSNIDNFSNDDELADTLEIISHEALKIMPRYSLANRIKKFFFKNGWFEGYMAHKAEVAATKKPKTVENSVDVYARTQLERMKAGKKRSSATIRAIKVLVGILSQAVESETLSSKVEETITSCVAEAIKNNKEINIVALEKAFSPGDRKKLPAVDVAITKMRHLGGEDNNGEAGADTGTF
jgi:predicted house-cleaning noncanonical NTP pyrophosphatase (MazG superfamily)